MLGSTPDCVLAPKNNARGEAEDPCRWCQLKKPVKGPKPRREFLERTQFFIVIDSSPQLFFYKEQTKQIELVARPGRRR